jgi:hypothetical protein
VSELADLLHPGPPSFHLTGATTDDLGIAAIALARTRPTVAVRRLRGSRCRTTTAFFDELAAVMQFPTYFGHNWNAARDMLRDLHWLPAEAYLLLIEDADELLADEPDEVLGAGLGVLARVAESAGPIPFHYVLQAGVNGTGTDSRAAKALGTNGTTFGTVEL